MPEAVALAHCPEDEELLDRVALAFSEAFTPAVRHAYSGIKGDVCVCVDAIGVRERRPGGIEVWMRFDL